MKKKFFRLSSSKHMNPDQKTTLSRMVQSAKRLFRTVYYFAMAHGNSLSYARKTNSHIFRQYEILINCKHYNF